MGMSTRGGLGPLHGLCLVGEGFADLGRQAWVGGSSPLGDGGLPGGGEGVPFNPLDWGRGEGARSSRKPMLVALAVGMTWREEGRIGVAGFLRASEEIERNW